MDARRARLPARRLGTAHRVTLAMAATTLVAFAPLRAEATAVGHVIAISFDGLRPDALAVLGPQRAPHFHFMIEQGASTLNARTDPDFTNTLPNHTDMLTGRVVLSSAGHGWASNDTPTETLHAHRGDYVASVFDVVHDHGRSTAFFVSKTKFSLFTSSWEDEGAADLVPPDQGRDKIDWKAITSSDDDSTLSQFLATLTRERPSFSFVHFAGPDRVGHAASWDVTPGSAYLTEVEAQDARLGQILGAVRSEPALAGSTVVIATADHGGSGTSHSSTGVPEHYTVPLLVWGAGVEAGTDLYALNEGLLFDPGTAQVPLGAARQPLRNGHLANLVTQLLGLPPVPGSTLGTEQALRTGRLQVAGSGCRQGPTGGEAGASLLLVLGLALCLGRCRARPGRTAAPTRGPIRFDGGPGVWRVSEAGARDHPAAQESVALR